MEEKAWTWARYHPDVAEAFERFEPWPAEIIKTDHALFSQSSLAIGPDDELVVNAWPLDEGTKAAIHHSSDRGVTWEDPVELDASLWMNVAGMSRVTEAPGGTALWHFHCGNQPRPGHARPIGGAPKYEPGKWVPPGYWRALERARASVQGSRD